LSNKQAINLTSLNVIQDELMVTIDNAATHLETFISERENHKSLRSCIAALQQIRGSLDLIQLHGACELAGEILTTAADINPEESEKLDDKLSALTKGFFVLSCYFEYALQNQKGMPVLLIPYINDIRVANCKPTMPEAYFETTTASYRLPSGKKTARLPKTEHFSSMVRRYRHMYQVGLLGFIREVRIKPSLQLMHRAVDKIVKLSKGTKSETLWWVIKYAIMSFEQKDMMATVARKRLLSHLDKEFKKFEKVGLSTFNQDPPEELLKELAYYVAIADIQEAGFQKIKNVFGLNDILFDEGHLQKESASLTGPNASTVRSVAEVLQVELNTVKEAIDHSQQNGGSMNDSYDEIIPRVLKIKDILEVVGLKSASKTMQQQLAQLESWHKNDESPDSGEALEMADALLYVESVLSSLEKRNFSDKKLAEINQLARKEMISSSHLADAQLVVIEEAEAGLSMVKRALTSFSDSSYDKAHIQNVGKSLTSVRGGMTVLELPRAASIVASSAKFIDEALMSTKQSAALEHMLETFADALICLEYYLDCMKVDNNVSSETLTVAEESLAALGYGVSYSGS